MKNTDQEIERILSKGRRLKEDVVNFINIPGVENTKKNAENKIGEKSTVNNSLFDLKPFEESCTVKTKKNSNMLINLEEILGITGEAPKKSSNNSMNSSNGSINNLINNNLVNSNLINSNLINNNLINSNLINSNLINNNLMNNGGNNTTNSADNITTNNTINGTFNSNTYDNTVNGMFNSTNNGPFNNSIGNFNIDEKLNDAMDPFDMFNNPLKNTLSLQETPGFQSDFNSCRPNQLFNRIYQHPSSSILFRNPSMYQNGFNTHGYSKLKKRRRLNSSSWSSYFPAFHPSKLSSFEFVHGTVKNESMSKNEENMVDSLKKYVKNIDFDNITVLELKNIMKEYGLNANGKKKEMIDKIKKALGGFEEEKEPVEKEKDNRGYSGYFF